MKNEKSPSEVLKRMGFADITPDQQHKAQMLISLNKGIKTARQKVSSLKQELLPVVQQQPIQVGDDIVIYVAGSKGTAISKQKLKQILMQEFHMSEMAAEAFIIKISVEKLMHPYVKVVSKTVLDRTAQILKNAKVNKTPVVAPTAVA